jgi:hypothetical protein
MLSFYNKLSPIFLEDEEEWAEVKTSLTSKKNIMWYGGSGFDLKPFVDMETGISPSEIIKVIQPNPLYLMTDYSEKLLNSFKGIYSNFDRDNFNLSGYLYDCDNVEIQQMIPLRFFDIVELKKLRQENTNFHSSVTTSVVPDDDWHFCYAEVSKGEITIDVLFGYIENLVFWKDIAVKFDLKVDIFCALRVGGKSGSWDNTHSPENGKLFSEIKNSVNCYLPKYWIADNCGELRKIWDEINPSRGSIYGKQYFFKTNFI